MTRFSIAAPELARLTHNALAFMPARSAVKVCRVVQNIGSLSLMATDLFSIGYDSSSIDTENDTAAVDLSRDDLVALDKMARARKKEDVRIEIRQGDGMSIEGDDGSWMPFLDASDRRQPEDLWDRCLELLTRLERIEPTIPEALLIDPAILAKFAKIKCHGETIADLYIAFPDGPILVKIGYTFLGAMMPVDRTTAAQSEGVGQEGLWDLS